MSEVALSSNDWTGPMPPRGGMRWAGLAGFMAAVIVAALIGVVSSLDAQQVYDALYLPAFAPPAWLFGPAWSILYVMMAAAAWLVWTRRGWDRSLTWWCVQLALNAAWTPLFFAAELFWVALVELWAMWFVILGTTWLFWRRREVSAWLMVPYLLWVPFAGALNLGIALLN